MATAFSPPYRATTVQEFLDADFGELKAELVDGLILMMAGGSPRHAAICMNLGIALGNRLLGTGCRPYGSDLAVRTSNASIRFPDIAVYCRNDKNVESEHPKLIGDPRVIFEVLSPSTSSNDQIVKLAEYRALPGVQAVVFVDPATERVRLVRTDEAEESGWQPEGSDLDLPMLGISLPASEIFEAG